MAGRAAQRKGRAVYDQVLGKDGAKGRTSYAIAVADIPSGSTGDRGRRDVRALRDLGALLYVTANKTLMVVPFDQNLHESRGRADCAQRRHAIGTLGRLG